MYMQRAELQAQTIDESQNDEADVVIISLAMQQEMALLRAMCMASIPYCYQDSRFFELSQWQNRANMGISRAKYALIIVGSCNPRKHTDWVELPGPAAVWQKVVNSKWCPDRNLEPAFLPRVASDFRASKARLPKFSTTLAFVR
jgi:hypothetical protein